MARSTAKVTFNVKLARDVAMRKAEAGVRAAALETQRIMQQDVLASDPPRSGRYYKRGKRVSHRASAPGESPAPDTGQLRASVQVEFIQGGGAPHAKVFSNLEKAAALQLGTDKVAPRPWLSRFTEFQARIKAAFVFGSKLGR